MTEKTPRVSHVWKAPGPKSLNVWVTIYLCLKNYVTSEGAISHNVLYYQQLSIARYEVSLILAIILSNYQ